MRGTLIDRRALGARLHMLRWDRGWSAKDVAERTGVSEASLLRWERAVGKKYPPSDRIQQLAEILGVEMSDLLDPDYDTRVWFNGRRRRAA